MTKSTNTSHQNLQKQKTEPIKKRFEYKYWIDWKTYSILRPRIRSLLSSDSNCDENGEYFIRSVYFDSPQRHCVREKEDGLENRKKYRARCYGKADVQKLKFEIKYRDKNKIWKNSLNLSKEQYIHFLHTKETPSNSAFSKELSYDFRRFALSPMTIVQYTREAYIYPVSNVRITFDKHLCHSSFCTDIFRNHPQIYAHPKDRLILEVKFNDFLPPLIRSILFKQLPKRTSISKYLLCYHGAYQ